jgi:hypothetical protein
MPMPRRARLTYPGCALHLIQHGNNRAVFRGHNTELTLRGNSEALYQFQNI